MNRNSYTGLSSLPAYGIYRHGKLVVSVRAESYKEAGVLFAKHGFYGKIVRVKNEIGKT